MNDYFDFVFVAIGVAVMIAFGLSVISDAYDSLIVVEYHGVSYNRSMVVDVLDKYWGGSYCDMGCVRGSNKAYDRLSVISCHGVNYNRSRMIDIDVLDKFWNASYYNEGGVRGGNESEVS